MTKKHKSQLVTDCFYQSNAPSILHLVAVLISSPSSLSLINLIFLIPTCEDVPLSSPSLALVSTISPCMGWSVCVCSCDLSLLIVSLPTCWYCMDPSHYPWMSVMLSIFSFLTSHTTGCMDWPFLRWSHETSHLFSTSGILVLVSTSPPHAIVLHRSCLSTASSSHLLYFVIICWYDSPSVIMLCLDLFIVISIPSSLLSDCSTCWCEFQKPVCVLVCVVVVSCVVCSCFGCFCVVSFFLERLLLFKEMDDWDVRMSEVSSLLHLVSHLLPSLQID